MKVKTCEVQAFKALKNDNLFAAVFGNPITICQFFVLDRQRFVQLKAFVIDQQGALSALIIFNRSQPKMITDQAPQGKFFDDG